MTLTKIPLSPTSNHAYKHSSRGMYPTPAMLKFQKHFQAWKLLNEYELGVTKNYLNNQIAKTKDPKLEFIRTFYFKHEDLYYKNGKRRKLDITNRIKYLDDYICQALDIDDHLIHKGSEEIILADETNVSVTINMLQ